MEGSGEGRGVEWEGELSGEGRGVGRGGGVVTRCEDNELGRHGNAGEWSMETITGTLFNSFFGFSFIRTPAL